MKTNYEKYHSIGIEVVLPIKCSSSDKSDRFIELSTEFNSPDWYRVEQLHMNGFELTLTEEWTDLEFHECNTATVFHIFRENFSRRFTAQSLKDVNRIIGGKYSDDDAEDDSTTCIFLSDIHLFQTILERFEFATKGGPFLRTPGDYGLLIAEDSEEYKLQPEEFKTLRSIQSKDGDVDEFWKGVVGDWSTTPFQLNIEDDGGEDVYYRLIRQ